MTPSAKILITPEENQEMVKYLSRTMSISRWLASFLVNRGIVTPREAGFFLFGDLCDLPSPFELKDMDRAVARIKKAIKNGEEIMVYGDYDADGITATALLTYFLRKEGGKVFPFLPRREREGYGLDGEAVKKAAKSGIKLLITVDCGSKNEEEISLGRTLGMDVIVTDHHQIEKLPQANAVINPYRSDDSYPFPELAGVGVAYKLCQGILEERGERACFSPRLVELLPLVAIGTIADLVSLREENRILVKEGLRELEQTSFIGLNALLKTTGIKGQINSGNISFGLAPRLNAAGRLKTAKIALELLLTEDPLKAERLSEVLDRLNRRRQAVEEKIVKEARQVFSRREKDRILLAASPDWNPGVVGIAASKLVEEFSRPVLLIGLEGNEGKGSGRSIPGFDLYKALKSAEDCLVKFGGHPMAAGFTVEASKVEELDQKMNQFALENLPEDLLRKRISVEGLIDLEQTDFRLIDDIEQLAPFGIGNPRPLFSNESLTIREKRQVGREGKHLQLKLASKGKKLFRQAIAFRMGPRFAELEKGKNYQVVFAPKTNDWNGRREVQLEVRDISPSYIKEAKEKKALGKGSFSLVTSGNFKPGREKIIKLITEEISSSGKNGIYLTPTLHRLNRAWQKRPGKLECGLISGLKTKKEIRAVFRRLEEEKPFLLFMSFPVFFYYYSRLSFLPLILAWESPYPDFPPASFYRLLERDQGNWENFFGLEFSKFDWKLPFYPERKIELGRKEMVLQKIKKEEFLKSSSIPICSFSGKNKEGLRENYPGRELIDSREAVDLKNNVLGVVAPPSTGGEILTFLEDFQGGRIAFADGAVPRAKTSQSLDRDKLVRIYLELRGEAGPILLKNWQAKNQEDPSLIKQALLIFQELDLVKIREAGEGKWVEIKKTKGRNVDLFRSLRYNEFVNEKEAYLRWSEILKSSLSHFNYVLGGAENGT